MGDWVASGVLGGTMSGVYRETSLSALRLNATFHRAAGFFFAVDEITKRLDGNNRPRAYSDGADFAVFHQCPDCFFAQVKHLRRSFYGNADTFSSLSMLRNIDVTS